MKHIDSIVRLDWDSSFFNMEVGRIYKKKDTPQIAIDKKSRYDLIYLHSESPISNTESVCYDKKITFYKNVSPKKKKETIDHSIIPYTGILTTQLLNLTLASGAHSRFKKDPKLDPYFDNLYKLWIENSLNKKIADHTYVYQIKNEILGFITLKKKVTHHQIGLIATSKKHRGLGIGTALIEKVEETVLAEKGKKLQVVTQLDNTIACNFYAKNDFKKKTIEYIYHIWP